MTAHTLPPVRVPSTATSRRQLLTRGTRRRRPTVTTTLFGSTFRQTAYAATNGNVLVVLSLRGGCDGLSLVVPHGDPAYAVARPNIAVPTAPLIGKGCDVRPPSRIPATRVDVVGRPIAAIHATGLPQPNRSHFSASRPSRMLTLAPATRTGWINRLIGLDTATRRSRQSRSVPGCNPPPCMGRSPRCQPNAPPTSLSGASDETGMLRRRRALTQVWGEAAALSASPHDPP